MHECHAKHTFVLSGEGGAESGHGKRAAAQIREMEMGPIARAVISEIEDGLLEGWYYNQPGERVTFFEPNPNFGKIGSRGLHKALREMYWASNDNPLIEAHLISAAATNFADHAFRFANI
jgi:hypothetical protein